MAYKGRWRPKNREKYDGDPTRIRYRSLWERQAFKWCDDNENIECWSSETVVVPYRSSVDRKMHKYFTDLKIRYKGGRVVLVEIKPKKQTVPPKKTAVRGRRQISEARTFAINQIKFEAATSYAKDRGWRFEVWTEDTLKSLGIKILTRKKRTKKNG